MIMIISVIVIVTFNHIADLKSNEQTITKKSPFYKIKYYFFVWLLNIMNIWISYD